MTAPRLFAVVGCQRCGTTLLGMVLGTNSSVRYYDEDGFYPVAVYRTQAYQTDMPNIGFKLTTLTPETQKFKQENPEMKFLFMNRDILDVCSSMLKLRWVIPSLLGEELQISLNNLYPSPYRTWVAEKFLELDYGANAHKLAALYAQTRFNLVQEYQLNQLNFMAIEYEDFVANPLRNIKGICEFLKIVFDLQMTMHHKK